jgi:hypothetical protein
VDAEELVEQAAQEGLTYLPNERKFVSPALQAAVSKFGAKKVGTRLTTEKIKSIVNATLTNYRNIKRICDTTQDPSYCYMSEAILPYLENALDEFEQGINIAKPLKIYKIDENNNIGEVLLEIHRPHDY